MSTTCKEEAVRWVHRYAIGGAAFALLPLPVSTSTGLATMETHMMSMIGGIYGEPAGGVVTAAAGSTFAVMGQGLKWIACRAAGYVPYIGPVVRMAIAAATIESLGHAIVAHYERKHPGKHLAETASA